MSVVRSLWTSVQGDPVFMRRVNGWLTIFWVAMIPIAYEAGWLTSVTFVSALSLWALGIVPIEFELLPERGDPGQGSNL